MDLKGKIADRSAKVCVMGLGYVGLPLITSFAKAGFSCVGIDIDEKKISSLSSGISHINSIPDDLLSELASDCGLKFTRDTSVLKECEVILICVPTPLNKTKDPDISHILSAIGSIKENLRKDQLIVLESTTYPGTTEELVLTDLSQTDLEVGVDFFLAFSPEREDPGNKDYNISNTPKLVAGVTDACTEMARTVYEKILEEIVVVSSPKVAEMVKLLENTFRSVNIALVNEVALMCDTLDIDVWEVIDAAGTKPFGFMKFYPGPGLGGHCIPVDPHYLSWKLKSMNYYARFIQLASEINAGMPTYVVTKVTDALNQVGKSVKGSKILVLGVAYKKDVSDTRESPSLDIIELLIAKGACVSYADPLVPDVQLDSVRLKSEVQQNLITSRYDCVVIATDHSTFDYKAIVENAQLVVDTRNVTKGMDQYKEKIVKI